VSARRINYICGPCDETHEFVEGRVRNVGYLIGIARNQRAIRSAIGVPFHVEAAMAAAVFCRTLRFDTWK